MKLSTVCSCRLYILHNGLASTFTILAYEASAGRLLSRAVISPSISALSPVLLSHWLVLGLLLLFIWDILRVILSPSAASILYFGPAA